MHPDLASIFSSSINTLTELGITAQTQPTFRLTGPSILARPLRIMGCRTLHHHLAFALPSISPAPGCHKEEYPTTYHAQRPTRACRQAAFLRSKSLLFFPPRQTQGHHEPTNPSGLRTIFIISLKFSPFSSPAWFCLVLPEGLVGGWWAAWVLGLGA